MPKGRQQAASRQAEPSPEDHGRARAFEDVRRVQASGNRVDLPWPKVRPRYVVTVYLREVGESFECASFSVTSSRPGVSVGSAVVRSLPVGSLVREAVRVLLANRLAESDEQASARSLSDAGVLYFNSPEDVEDFLRQRRAFWRRRITQDQERLGKPTGTGTGRRYPPGHLENVVAPIVKAARRHNESAAAAVAEVLGISKTAAANQISRAKAQGLLDADKKEEEQ